VCCVAVMISLANFVQNMDPVMIPITEAISIRWYGFSYLLGFLAAYLLLKYLAQRQLWALRPSMAGDYISLGAIFGVFLGGRLGYVLFYTLPKVGMQGLAADPLMLFRVWEGGMASHGGILGMMIFTYYYAKKWNVSWTGVGDGLAVVATLGLFFGRMANFINGELYGHKSDAPWAVRFPSEFVEQSGMEEKYEQARAITAAHDPEYAALLQSEGVTYTQVYEGMLASLRDYPKAEQEVGELLTPRHPSQVYEGLLEGLVLFAILWFVRLRFPKLANGVLTGMFFILYAIFRIFVENYRVPDAALTAGFTRGQFISLFMIVAGIAFIVVGLKRGRTVADDVREIKPMPKPKKKSSLR